MGKTDYLCRLGRQSRNIQSRMEVRSSNGIEVVEKDNSGQTKADTDASLTEETITRDTLLDTNESD